MKKVKRNIIPILVLLFIFFVFIIFFMVIIRAKLDSQGPPFEQLMTEKINRNFDLKILGITLQRITFTINDSGEFTLKVYDERALYLFPLICSFISTFITGVIIYKLKKYIKKWEI